MSRMSPEARAAAALRAGGTRPKAPSHLPPKAKRIWREIVEAKPADFFDPGNLGLLAELCDLHVIQRDALAKLRDAPTDEKLGKLCCSYAAATAGLSQKLRLTIQSALRGDAGKLHEKPAPRSSLLGGNVTALRKG